MLQKSYINIIIKGWIRDQKVLFHTKSKIEVIKQDCKNVIQEFQQLMKCCFQR